MGQKKSRDNKYRQLKVESACRAGVTEERSLKSDWRGGDNVWGDRVALRRITNGHTKVSRGIRDKAKGHSKEAKLAGVICGNKQEEKKKIAHQ